MTRLIGLLALSLLLASVSGCASHTKTDAVVPQDKATQIANLFEGREGCFTVYDINARKTVFTHNKARCEEQVPPCSTFKVPLALMAFDSNVLKDENTLFKWDGKDKGMEAWNRDHTAASWMKDSVIWYSQKITPKLGRKKLAAYLARFDYGNGDMSAGSTKFWLNSSLKVSANEQILFWDKFWRDELAVASRATQYTKKITFVETSPNGFELNGKTGSGMGGITGGDGKTVLGWYVGHIGKDDQQYVFATNFTAPRDPNAKGFPGWTAREISKKALGILGLW